MENSWILPTGPGFSPSQARDATLDDDLIDAIVAASMQKIPYQPQAFWCWEDHMAVLPATSEEMGVSGMETPHILYMSPAWLHQSDFPTDLIPPRDRILFDASLAYPTPTPSPASSASSCVAPSTPAAPVGHQCQSCTASFSRASELQRHERKHTKPFVCPVCNRGHAAKKDMHRHLWTHHPTEAERLKIPMQTRTCNQCGAVERQDNLARHMRTRHGGGSGKR